MMIECMRDRNYLAANDVYLKLAIGNSPWPIGVTSVGIHERSAREKISHVMNSSGKAHIMNDEATRKWVAARAPRRCAEPALASTCPSDLRSRMCSSALAPPAVRSLITPDTLPPCCPACLPS